MGGWLYGRLVHVSSKVLGFILVFILVGKDRVGYCHSIDLLEMVLGFRCFDC